MKGKVNIPYLEATVWCKLAPSSTHGVGVFALRDIKAGQELYVWGTQDRTMITCEHLEGVDPAIRDHILSRWPDARTHPFLHPHDEVWLLSFMNHDGANCNYDKLTDKATRDIKAGEEITEDYGYDPTM